MHSNSFLADQMKPPYKSWSHTRILCQKPSHKILNICKKYKEATSHLFKVKLDQRRRTRKTGISRLYLLKEGYTLFYLG